MRAHPRGWLAGRSLLLVAFWLALSAGCPAQVPATQADPEATAHAIRLREAFEATGLEVDAPSFLQLFETDPNLSRRAFVALLALGLEESEPARVESLWRLLESLAPLAWDKFDDHIPNRILEAIIEERPSALSLAARYSSFLRQEAAQGRLPTAERLRNYGPYDDTYFIVFSVEDLPSGLPAPLKMGLTKLSRYDAAVALGNFEAALNERATYPAVVKRVKEMATGSGSAQELLEGAGTELSFRDADLAMDIELGLLEEALDLLTRPAEDPHLFSADWAALRLATSRVAFNQARLPASKRMLELAREEMAADPEVSRQHFVLEYVIRTSDYRTRKVEGFEPGATQVVEEFRKAWSALDDYEAMVSYSVDRTWQEGRHATRFWLEELARLPQDAAEPCLRTIRESWDRWWEQTLAKQQQLSGADNLLYHEHYLVAYHLLGSNYFDCVTYRWAKFPHLPLAASNVDRLESALDILPRRVSQTVEGQSGPGFPSFDLASGGLLRELKARCQLVKARMPGASDQARLELLTDSLAHARASQQPGAYADHLLAVGKEFKKLGEEERAFECWRNAAQLSEQHLLTRPAFEAALLLAREHFESKDWEKALTYAEQATAKLEAASPLVGARSLEARAWSAELASITTLAAQAHIAADAPDKALAVLTRGQQLRSAALQVEGMPEAKQDSAELRRQEQAVAMATEQLTRLEVQPASALRDELLGQTRQVLAESKAAYLLKSRELRQKHATLYATALKFDPLDLPGLRGKLPADVAVLQFFPTESMLYTFLVTRDSFRLHSVPIGDKELDRLVVDFLRGLRRNVAKDASLAAQSRKLFDALIAPCVPNLEGKSSLVLIPTGRLHGLPFACLSDEEGQPLVQRWRLLELARTTDLTRLSDQGAGPIESVVAFTNATGDLPAAAVEGRKIAAMFPQARLFERKEATRSNLFAFGGGAQVLHLATHGEWNLDDSLKNYLALAGSERVAQEEIFQLGLDKTSLVILSACNTAMGEGEEGGYVASLAEAFWLAGSRSVIASLWAVNDGSTALLMETFYQRLQAGDDKAEALRAAQLAVRAKEGFEHPYYWAGFVLFGERS